MSHRVTYGESFYHFTNGCFACRLPRLLFLSPPWCAAYYTSFLYEMLLNIRKNHTTILLLHARRPTKYVFNYNMKDSRNIFHLFFFLHSYFSHICCEVQYAHHKRALNVKDKQSGTSAETVKFGV